MHCSKIRREFIDARSQDALQLEAQVQSGEAHKSKRIRNEPPSRDLEVIQHLLADDFAFATGPEYEWVHELSEAGCSGLEIVQLLLDNSSDSPWIQFTPQIVVRHPVQVNFHIPGCAHSTNPISHQLLPDVRLCSSVPTDVRRQVEELCGIGGVLLSLQDQGTWNGNVSFREQSAVSAVTYAIDPGSSYGDLMVRISNALANFCTAAATVQHNELCCNSFTFLLRVGNDVKLRHIDFHHAVTMVTYINLAIHDSDTEASEASVQRCAHGAKGILQELKVKTSETGLDRDLHYCALATQFLCVAFLSYLQAHIGPIDPFFLDTTQRKITLMGSHRLPGDGIISVDLVQLTWLGEMTQQPVLAFSPGVTTNLGTRRHDVLTNVENCLDTWGPGYLIHHEADPTKTHAIVINDGVVYMLDGEISQFHRTRGRIPECTSHTEFNLSTTMRIGAAFRINESCCMNEAACRESSYYALWPLATSSGFWEVQDRQAGLQGGKYVSGSYKQTWKKVPGTTLKQYSLQQSDWRLIQFLDQHWGLQVSFCTSVARRVCLRELVADLSKIFVNPLEHHLWQELVLNHDILQAFAQGDLFTWLRTLSPSL